MWYTQKIKGYKFDHSTTLRCSAIPTFKKGSCVSIFFANLKQSKFVVQPLMISTIQTKVSCLLQYKQKQSVLIQS